MTSEQFFQPRPLGRRRRLFRTSERGFGVMFLPAWPQARVGLTVAAAQLPKLLGVNPDRQHNGFFRRTWSSLRQLDHASIPTLVLSAGAIGVLLAMARWAPRIPGPLVVVAVGITLAAFTGRRSDTPDRPALAVVATSRT